MIYSTVAYSSCFGLRSSCTLCISALAQKRWQFCPIVKDPKTFGNLKKKTCLARKLGLLRDYVVTNPDML